MSWVWPEPACRRETDLQSWGSVLAGITWWHLTAGSRETDVTQAYFQISAFSKIFHLKPAYLCEVVMLTLRSPSRACMSGGMLLFTQSCPAFCNPMIPCPSLSPGACSNSRPLSRWCHLTTLSSVTPSSCLQSFPASGSFPMSRLFPSAKVLELQLQHQSFQ